MAYDLLTVQGVNSFVDDWRTGQTKKTIDPLTAKKKNYTDLDTIYASLIDKVSSLKSSSYSLQQTGTSSAFLSKKTTSSNTTFVDLAATSASVASSQSIRINQLAKSDTVISKDLTSIADSSTITTAGTHTFDITAGDGLGGVLTSHINVTFDAEDFTNAGGKISNLKVIQTLQDALSSNKAVINSNSVTGSSASAGSFNLNMNGTVTTINYSAGTYSDIMDSIVTQINKVAGINASKVVNGSDVQLQITVTDSSKYLTIDGDTSGLVSELNIGTIKLMGASGLVDASVFSPDSTLSQLSIAAKKSGNAYKLLSLTDTNGGTALESVKLNLGGTRTSFVQNLSGSDTPGYVYETDQLNAKFEFNGLQVERSSNTISDLIPGATVTLKSTMQTTDTTVSLSISSDSAKVMDKVQDFIKKFNDLYLLIKEKTKSTKEGRGILIGDSAATTLQSLLGSVASSSVSGISATELNSLSKIGISFSVTDGLSVSDSAQLEKAINEKQNQVEAVFNSTNGVAKNLYERLNPYVNANGYLYKARQNFNINTTYLDDKIKSAQERIDKNGSDLRMRYMKIMTQMNSALQMQGTFIMGNGFFRN